LKKSEIIERVDPVTQEKGGVGGERGRDEKWGRGPRGRGLKVIKNFMHFKI